MDKLSSVNSKSFLIRLVSDTISHSRTKHHLIATHEVEHDIFQSWLKSLRVDEIEVNLIIRGYLDSLVTFDEVNEASNIELVVLFPELNRLA